MSVSPFTGPRAPSCSVAVRDAETRASRPQRNPFALGNRPTPQSQLLTTPQRAGVTPCIGCSGGRGGGNTPLVIASSCSSSPRGQLTVGIGFLLHPTASSCITYSLLCGSGPRLRPACTPSAASGGFIQTLQTTLKPSFVCN